MRSGAGAMTAHGQRAPQEDGDQRPEIRAKSRLKRPRLHVTQKRHDDGEGARRRRCRATLAEEPNPLQLRGPPMKVLKIVPERCTGCLRCELACSYMQTGTFQPAKSVIRVSPFEGHTSYAPFTCTQCAEGWCMTACPVGAITITAVGAKDVIDDKCVGCKLCTIACPYGTMFY